MSRWWSSTATSASDREGFQQLVTEVSLGRAGIVMGLEVSRLARNSTDWHRLLEICALADTLILDEDGIYDPAHFNDRLLLGLKGTMSEAELHLLRARLIGGMMNKARRGELRMRLPVGFAYDGADRVILDPDQQVQQALRVFFETFRRVGSATATVKEFRRLKLRFPRRVQHGARKGEILWGSSSIIVRDGCCTIRVTPVCSAMAAAVNASTETPATGACRARSGSRSSPTPIPAISAGGVRGQCGPIARELRCPW